MVDVSASLRPPGRPALVSAAELVETLRLLIARAARAPCPTLGQMADATGGSQWAVRGALLLLQRAGALEMGRSADAAGPAGFRRRMRVLLRDGRWSAWTRWTPRGGDARRRDHAGAARARGGYGG